VHPFRHLAASLLFLVGPTVSALSVSAVGIPSAAASEPRPADVVADAILALPPGAPEAEKEALSAELAEAKKRVATVVLKPPAAGAPLAAGAVIVDGQHAADLPLRRPLYLEPGKRTIAVEVDGRRFVPIEATLSAGQNVAVTLREIEPAAPPPPPADDKPIWPGILLAGLGVAGVGAGIGLIVASAGKESDAESLGSSIGSCDTTSLSARCEQLASTVSDRNALQNGAVVAFVVGGVAGAASALYFLIPTPRETPDGAAPPVAVRPVLGPDAWGLSLRGAF